MVTKMLMGKKRPIWTATAAVWRRRSRGITRGANSTPSTLKLILAAEVEAAARSRFKRCRVRNKEWDGDKKVVWIITSICLLSWRGLK